MEEFDDFEGLTGDEIKEQLTRGGKVRWTTLGVKAYVKSQGEEVADVNFEYENMYQKVQIKCKYGDKCKNTYYMVGWNNYANEGTRCGSCSRKETKKYMQPSIEKVKEEFQKHDITVLENEYVNCKTKMRVKCNSCNHEFQKIYGDIYKNNVKSPLCSKKKIK